MIALFWIAFAGYDCPIPVVAESGLNLVVQLPGRPNLGLVPRSRQGSTWVPIPGAA